MDGSAGPFGAQGPATGLVVGLVGTFQTSSWSEPVGDEPEGSSKMRSLQGRLRPQTEIILKVEGAEMISKNNNELSKRAS